MKIWEKYLTKKIYTMGERDQLIRDEGLRLFPYRCPAGKLTIGVGRNLDDNPLTADEVMVFLLSRPDLIVNNTSINEVRALLLYDFTRVGITEDEAHYLLDNDIKKVVADINYHLPWVNDHPAEVKNILTNMAFQMGINGLLKFHNTLNHIKNKNYHQAAENMKQSLWAKQTPKRAKRLIKRMAEL